MAVRDQYYLENRIPECPENIISSEQEVVQRLEDLFSENWVSWDEFEQGERNITLVVHAPSSLLDMRRIGGVVSDHLVFADGTNQGLGLLPCTNLGTEWLISFINDRINTLEILVSTLEIPGMSDLNDVTATSLSQLNNIYRNYGSFQPTQLGLFHDSEGLNPILFALAVAIKYKAECLENHHIGRECLVIHPDMEYFISNGNVQTMRDVLQIMDSFYDSLGLEVYIENPIFTNTAFKDKLGWMQDPKELAELLPTDAKALGLCVDAHHLELLGYDGDGIEALLQSFNEVEPRTPLILHVDASDSVNDIDRPFIRYAYTKAIPVVYEPRGVK